MTQRKKSRIYITHCCAKKNNKFRNTKQKVTPDLLYIATPTKRFMKACKEKKVSWAIFSDNYGIWPYPVTHEWYDKNPNKVTDNEFKSLVEQFDKSLKSYEDIFFYHNPGRFHKLYKKLLTESKLKKRIQKFTHISEID